MADLVGVLPALREAELRLRAFAFARGIVYSVADFGGVRSEADTLKIKQYRQDDYAVYFRAYKVKHGGSAAGVLSISQFRPINDFGRSHHNYGAAFDVRMVKGVVGDLGKLAPSAGLIWGGTFSPKDVPHFQLPMSLVAVRDVWLGLRNVPGVAMVSATGGVGPSARTSAVLVLAVVLVGAYVVAS